MTWPGSYMVSSEQCSYLISTSSLFHHFNVRQQSSVKIFFVPLGWLLQLGNICDFREGPKASLSHLFYILFAILSHHLSLIYSSDHTNLIKSHFFSGIVALPIESDIIDKLLCSGCLNNHINLPDLIASFASRATASLVDKNRTKYMFPILWITSSPVDRFWY